MFPACFRATKDHNCAASAPKTLGRSAKARGKRPKSRENVPTARGARVETTVFDAKKWIFWEPLPANLDFWGLGVESGQINEFAAFREAQPFSDRVQHAHYLADVRAIAQHGPDHGGGIRPGFENGRHVRFINTADRYD